MEVDPDYEGFVDDPEEGIQEERSRILKENAVRGVAVERIKSIINEEFDKEIEMKESELFLIDQRLSEARCVMDRLRACVVASFYASSFTKPVDGAKGPDPGASQHPAIQNVLRKAVTTVLSRNAPHQPTPQKNEANKNKKEDETCEAKTKSAPNESSQDQPESSKTAESSSTSTSKTQAPVKEKPPLRKNKKVEPILGGRQRIKKTVIVGNISKYIPSDQREASDKSTHKWMVYVRGSKEEPRIDHFVRKVWFFLHPSYRPNDLVEVCEAPFHLTRRGWGEFPVRVQIHFCDRRNRPVDIIHGLRLDRTYTGLQTLGAETVCEVELDRSSVHLSVDDILDVANLPNLTPENDEDKQEKENNPENSEMLNGTLEGTSSSYASKFEVKDQGETDKVTDVNGLDNDAQPGTSNMTIPSNELSPSRKRKLDEAEKEEQGDTSSVLSTDAEKNGKDDSLADKADRPTPTKRRRKRRRNSHRTSASEDDILSDSTTSGSFVEENDQKIIKSSEKGDSASECITLSHTLDTNSKNSDKPSVEMNGDITMDDADEKESSTSSKHESSNDSHHSISLSDMKQPVVILPRSPVTGNAFFRMRSASDGEGFPNRSCANLIKSGVTVTPVLNIKLNQDAQTASDTTSNSGSPPTKKGDSKIASPKRAKSTTPPKNASSMVNSNSVSILKLTEENPSNPSPNKIKKDPSEPTHITIPLSALLKTGGGLPQTQIIKLSQPSSVKSPMFSINMSHLTGQASSKPRQKRSFSADHPPSHTFSVTSAGAKSRGTSPTPIQVQIISSPPPLKKSKNSMLQPITLQTLQAALSSGTLTLSQPNQGKAVKQPESTQKKQDGQHHYILTTVKGKQQLTLLQSPSHQGSGKKLYTIVGSSLKGKKVATGMKQVTVQKVHGSKTMQPSTGSRRPSQQEVIPMKPVHEAIANKIQIHSSMTSLVEDILPQVVKHVPLICEKRDVSQFPFCAPTEADFLEWNVGKQRASEWQRAVLILKVLKQIQEKSEALKKCELPSKKFVMTWCLRHGYTVFTDEFVEEEGENDEGTDQKVEEVGNQPLSMTTAADLLKLLDKKKEERDKQDGVKTKDDGDVIFVDVVTVDPPLKILPEIKQEPSDGAESSPEKQLPDDPLLKKIQQMIESPEVACVEEMTRDIGVNLHRSYRMPTCHIVLAKALQQFTESLLRKSHATALFRRDGSSFQRVAPEEIRVVDVASAIRETASFDFLTDKNTASDT